MKTAITPNIITKINSGLKFGEIINIDGLWLWFYTQPQVSAQSDEALMSLHQAKCATVNQIKSLYPNMDFGNDWSDNLASSFELISL